MPAAHKPRSGSLQFWPRVRSKRIYSSIKSWLKNNNNELVGFAGYKAGMTHIIEKKDGYTPQTKNQSVFTAVTIIECPPLKPFSLRFYNKTPYGSEVISQIYSKNLDKELSKKVTLPKKQPEISSERRCWEINRCKKIKCVAYNNRDLRCWLHVGVQCKKNSRAPCFDKIATCKYCKIYKNRFNK